MKSMENEFEVYLHYCRDKSQDITCERKYNEKQLEMTTVYDANEYVYSIVKFCPICGYKNE